MVILFISALNEFEGMPGDEANSHDRGVQSVMNIQKESVLRLCKPEC